MQSDKSYDKDSPVNVVILAVVLCVVCSLVVSSAAVGLRSWQDANVLLDKRANILSVAGFEDVASGDVNDVFGKRFTVELIDMNTGLPAAKDAMEAMDAAGKKYADEEDTIAKYDQIWASKSKKPSISDPTDDATLIKYREKFSHVYVLKSEDGSAIEKYVFPVRGYGLWSMMKGYLAVEPDLQKIAGLTFYEHGETPGLGGEIKSATFKAQWPGKQIYGDDGSVAVRVIKAAPKDAYSVDALSGATITSTGVSNMMKYWLGPEGFGPYIDQKKGKAETAQTTIKSGDTNNG
jgi:Na+-transporting NADH:ubiquinone oxidoreductase subunit C